jgi:hypothetical protein
MFCIMDWAFGSGVQPAAGEGGNNGFNLSIAVNRTYSGSLRLKVDVIVL